ncbi:hypothetical protein [Pedobacter sp. BMA]|uniref:hypothetical protein n=1 Tax=Pedobacter sp. BMA TaxID=1663685 RepID=UPI0018CD79F4|nr:hypothetical protein [Pedobacter sp. BMA]
MMNTYTKKAKTNGLVLDGLKAVGDSAGLKASKSKIKKEVQLSFSIVNQLTEMLFTKRGMQNRKEIEMAGLGIIALYNIYRGVKKGKRSPLVKGVFLAGILTAALIVNNKATSPSGIVKVN